MKYTTKALKIKYVLIYFILFFSIQNSFAQEEHDYYGAIKLNDSTLISYKLVFQLNIDSSITGYSITGLAGEHETKSQVIGKYDKDSKILNFNETSIIYTKSPVSELDFCFVHFYSDSFKINKSNKLSGVFVGKFSDNSECINGVIRMQKSEKLIQRMTKVSKKIENSKRIPDSLKQRVNPIKMMDKLNMNVLKEKEVMSVFSSQDKVQLILYDGGQEDGDVVSIFVNGKSILNKHLISSQKEILNISLTTDKTRIVIKAESVGTISTNTAVIEINDNNNNIRALTNLKKGEETTIDILKSK